MIRDLFSNVNFLISMETNMQNTYFTKRERHLLRRQQPKRSIKKIFFVGAAILIIGGGIFGLIQFQPSKPAAPKSNIVAKGGIHWHTKLSIKILDQYQDIPSNIGIGITHLPIHTHDADGVIHMEFSGIVKEDDIRLGRFFENWGKSFNKDCVLDKCSDPDGQFKMLVNGEKNSEFENYIMKDEDKVEIVFEQ